MSDIRLQFDNEQLRSKLKHATDKIAQQDEVIVNLQKQIEILKRKPQRKKK